MAVGKIFRKESRISRRFSTIASAHVDWAIALVSSLPRRSFTVYESALSVLPIRNRIHKAIASANGLIDHPFTGGSTVGSNMRCGIFREPSIASCSVSSAGCVGKSAQQLLLSNLEAMFGSQGPENRGPRARVPPPAVC